MLRTAPLVVIGLDAGAKWREMPKNLGSPTTCWRWDERWCGNGTWARITAALELPEIEAGRELRHMPRAARSKPTIDVEAVEVGPFTARRSPLRMTARSHHATTGPGTPPRRRT